jgi:hypothetical protein
MEKGARITSQGIPNLFQTLYNSVKDSPIMQKIEPTVVESKNIDIFANDYVAPLKIKSAVTPTLIGNIRRRLSTNRRPLSESESGGK